MRDTCGRRITYLRVSVTDRCDFRCLYCMAENMTFLPKPDVLTLEELERLCLVFIRKGIRKIRFTGGEPLVRRNILCLFNALKPALARHDLDEMTLTTNASQLTRYAHALVQQGMKRVNVSLDTLKAEKFSHITRRGHLHQVLDGIMAAKAAGLRIKINTVALKNFNEDEYAPLVAWCGEHGFDISFIETMPLGSIDGERHQQYLSTDIVRQHLETEFTLIPTLYTTGGPSRYYRVKETSRRVGFISPHSHNFCATCNRVRVTCTGVLYPCLGHESAVDLRTPLRRSKSDDLLSEAIDRAIALKPKEHDFRIEPGSSPAVKRHMSVTGG